MKIHATISSLLVIMMAATASPGAQDGTKVNVSFVDGKPVWIPLEKAGDVFRGTYENLKVTVRDRNKNGSPDLAGDLWIWDMEGKPAFVWAFSTNCLFHFNVAGKDFNESNLYAGAVSAGKSATADYMAANIAGDLKAALLQKTGSLIFPDLILENWDGSGKYLVGDLLHGGTLASGRAIVKNGIYEVYDLDGDHDPDMAVFKTTWGPGAIWWDFKDELTDLVTIDMRHPRMDIKLPTRTGLAWSEGKSFFYEKCVAGGKTYKGAITGEDEDDFIFEKPQELFKDGAQFMIYTFANTVTALTMGFGEQPLGWNIELTPLMDLDGQKPRERICEYRDPWDHSYRFVSCVLPQAWDGKALAFRSIPIHGVKEFFPDAPWKQTTTGDYFKLWGLHFCIVNEGEQFICDELMYGGTISVTERIEEDKDGASFVLYYSTLMGGLHLKRADIGYEAYPSGYKGPHTNPFDFTTLYHREALARPPQYVGARSGMGDYRLWLMDAPEGKRLEGPIFLYYKDRNKEGHFDTYFYDAENDGRYEMLIYYDEARRYVVADNGTFSVFYPYSVQHEEVSYQMENFDKIRALYRKGFGELPLAKRLRISSSGKPVEINRISPDPTISYHNLDSKIISEMEAAGSRLEPAVYAESSPEFYVAVGNSWKNRVGLYHPMRGYVGTWRDFGVDGFVRFNTLLHENSMVETEEIPALSEEALGRIDVLFIPQLDGVMPSRDLEAVLKWVKQGGIAVLGCQEDEAQRLFLNAAGRLLGFSFRDGLLAKRTILYKEGNQGGFDDPKVPRSEERYPGAWNRVENFKDHRESGILAGVKYASFVGYPLQLKEPFKPFLGWQDNVLIGEAKLGKGKILVSGINCFANKYINHPQYFETVDNDRLLENLVKYLCAAIPQKAQLALPDTPKPPLGFEISGRGGQIMIPDTGEYVFKANGKEIELERDVKSLVADLPAGRYQVQISKMEEKR